MIRTTPAHAEASVTPLARALPPIQPSADAIDNWDCLFRAVLARLRSTVAGGRLGAPATPQAQDPAAAARLQVIVLECVEALGQLHPMLSHERRQSLALTMQGLVIQRFNKPQASSEQVVARRRSASPSRRASVSPHL